MSFPTRDPSFWATTLLALVALAWVVRSLVPEGWYPTWWPRWLGAPRKREKKTTLTISAGKRDRLS